MHAARSDFKYAPAFDLNDYPGWGTASDAQLALWAYAFRDEAIAAGADLFSFNEAPSTTGANAGLREKMIVLLRALAAPDARGVSLRGVLFLTEQAATPAKWTSSATPFWRAVNETCDAVVAEHFHGQGFICQNSLSDLADHLFAMREWLEASGNEDKQQIANQKFTVMHSTRYSPGPSGWAGADSDHVTLPAFQRNLSRAVLATRSRAGGFNRVAFGPMQDSLTAGGVHPRIALLARWHYAQGGGSAELACVANASVNCRCAE